MMDWLRWWDGACSDPKWRVVSARCHQPVGNVVAVWAWLLEFAGRHDGKLDGLDLEEMAVTFGYDQADVESIVAAMQDKGLVQDGAIKNWHKRQPKREDDSRDRVAKWRAAKRGNGRDTQAVTTGNAPVTRGNAPDTETETDTERGFAGSVDTEPSTPHQKNSLRSSKKGSRIADDWKPSDELVTYAKDHGLAASQIAVIAEKFRNYWRSKAGQTACKLDWDATWRNWILSEIERMPKQTTMNWPSV